MSKVRKDSVLVKPVPVENDDSDLPVKGGHLIDRVHINIGLISKKFSGKSTVIYRMIEQIAGANTKVLIFSSTALKDNVYIQLAKMLEKKKIPYQIEPDIYDEDGVNLITEFMQLNSGFDEDNSDDGQSVNKTVPPRPILTSNTTELVRKKEKNKPKKLKYRAPDNIIIIDDLSNRLKDSAVNKLVRENRHYRSTVICSSQSIVDFSPSEINQLDMIMVFKNIPEERLEELHSKKSLAVPYEMFKTIYNFATNLQNSPNGNPCEFLFINCCDANGRETYKQSFHSWICSAG